MPDPAPPIPPDGALLDLLRAVTATGYRFTTPTPATHARVNARPGNEQAHDLAGVFGWSRPFGPGILDDTLLRLMDRAGVLVAEGGLHRSRLRISTLHGVNFLHSAYPTAAADAVFFGPDTYRFADAIRAELTATPRPGPRTVRRAVDIGCGAGPGAIVVARHHPEAEVLMVDINDAALRLAAVNASHAGATRAMPLRSDLLGATEGLFDLVVANPPYLVDPAERAYRHGGGPLGAGLSLAILDAALPRLAPGGRLLLYTGAAVVRGEDPFRTAALAQISDSMRWSYHEIDPDVFGEELEADAYREADRIAAVVLTVNRRE